MKHAKNIESRARAEFMKNWRKHAGKRPHGKHGAVSGPIAMLVQRVTREQDPA